MTNFEQPKKMLPADPAFRLSDPASGLADPAADRQACPAALLGGWLHFWHQSVGVIASDHILMAKFMGVTTTSTPSKIFMAFEAPKNVMP
jgi:hypothetical protein